MIGTLAGLVAGFVGLCVLTLGLWAVGGGWGLVGAFVAWAGVAVVLVKPEVLYARTA